MLKGGFSPFRALCLHIVERRHDLSPSLTRDGREGAVPASSVVIRSEQVGYRLVVGVSRKSTAVYGVAVQERDT